MTATLTEHGQNAEEIDHFIKIEDPPPAIPEYPVKLVFLINASTQW